MYNTVYILYSMFLILVFLTSNIYGAMKVQRNEVHRKENKETENNKNNIYKE